MRDEPGMDEVNVIAPPVNQAAGAAMSVMAPKALRDSRLAAIGAHGTIALLLVPALGSGSLGSQPWVFKLPVSSIR
jgi:hypothetical protein